MTVDARVVVGDCLAVMPTLDAESVDAIVTDPPYGLGFMGQKWDTYAGEANRAPSARAKFDHVGGNHNPSNAADAARTRRSEGKRYEEAARAWFTEALRVAKPGAHLVAFGGTRTYHRLTVAIEDAGWEIRDCLSWLYGSGFPKSHNGPWGGTALKPAWEPIILARKPLVGTVAANTQAHGTGALNIDGARIATDWDKDPTRRGWQGRKAPNGGMFVSGVSADLSQPHASGRWPANVCLDEDAAALIDAQSGERASSLALGERGTRPRGMARGSPLGEPRPNGPTYGDTGGASRFFYTAKASRAERNAGLDGMPKKAGGIKNDSGRGFSERDPYAEIRVANHHPTVKPLALMQWLCKLVTPRGGLILDPFCGSGTTGRAAIAEGFRFVGIELDEEYAAIARARLVEYAPLFAGPADP